MDSSTSLREREVVRIPDSVSAGRVRAFFVLSTLTTLAIWFQGVTAGQFLSQDNEAWVTTHGVIADASWVLALATAVVGFWGIRTVAPRLVMWAAALFVLALAQTGVGHLMTDYGKDLVAVHVPLAMAVMGLTVWVTIRAARADRLVHVSR
jgi:hypothetical protein